MTGHTTSDFGRIVNAATYLPRVRHEWVVVELRLPPEAVGLRDLFAIQMLVKLEDLLAHNKDVLSGSTAHLDFDHRALSMCYVPCCLSGFVIAGKRYEIDHGAWPSEMTVNCLATIEETQILPGDSYPWLIRATIRSGAVSWPRPLSAFIGGASLQAELWPAGLGGLTGIFLGGSQFQIEVWSGNKVDDKELRKRMQFIDVSRGGNGEINGVLWKHVEARSGDKTIQFETPRERLDELQQILKGVSAYQQLSVATASVEAEILVWVARKTAQGEPAVPFREIIVPGLAFTITHANEAGASWTPKAMFVSEGVKETHYELVNTDEVEYLKRHGEPAPDADTNHASLQVVFSKGAAPEVSKMADTALARTNLPAPRESSVVWQLAVLSPVPVSAHSSYKARPPAWVRYRFTPPALLPGGSTPGKAPPPGRGAESLDGLRGSFRFDLEQNAGAEHGWRIRASLDDDIQTALPGASPVRLRMLIRSSNTDDSLLSVALEMYGANLLAESPVTAIYQGQMNDPLSLPLERNLDAQNPDETHYVSARCVFRSDPFSRASVLNDETAGRLIVARFNPAAKTTLQLHTGSDGITAWLPASRALVDPVSPSAGNIVGKQIISLPVLRAPVVLLSVATDVNAGTTTLELAAQPEIQTGMVDFYAALIPSSKRKPTVLGRIVAVSHQGSTLLTLSGLLQPEAMLGPVTATAGSADLQSQSHGLATGDRVCVLRGDLSGDLPPAFLFHVVKVNSTTFQLSATDGGAPITPATSGSGLFISAVMEAGPTRLALPRDPNHGLVPLELREITSFAHRHAVRDPRPLAELKYSLAALVGSEIQAVMAMLPWAEWGPMPGEWLATGRVRLHHRNLIQEHAEFESAFEDRFPPSGPKNSSGEAISPLLPFEDFVRAVRDRYTQASGNIFQAKKGDTNSRRIRNWLRRAKLVGKGGVEAQPLLDYSEAAGDPFPAITLNWTPASPAVPAPQELKVRRGDDPRSAKNWLDFEVEPLTLETGSRAEFQVSDPSSSAGVHQRRVTNSSAPLLFNKQAATAVAMANLSDGGYCTLKLQPNGDVAFYRSPYTAGTIEIAADKVTGDSTQFPKFPAGATATLAVNGQFYKIAERKSATELVLSDKNVTIDAGTHYELILSDSLIQNEGGNLAGVTCLSMTAGDNVVAAFGIGGAVVVMQLNGGVFEKLETPDVPAEIGACTAVCLTSRGAQFLVAAAFHNPDATPATTLYVLRFTGADDDWEAVSLSADAKNTPLVSLSADSDGTNDYLAAGFERLPPFTARITTIVDGLVTVVGSALPPEPKIKDRELHFQGTNWTIEERLSNTKLYLKDRTVSLSDSTACKIEGTGYGLLFSYNATDSWSFVAMDPAPPQGVVSTAVEAVPNLPPAPHASPSAGAKAWFASGGRTVQYIHKLGDDAPSGSEWTSGHGRPVHSLAVAQIVNRQQRTDHAGAHFSFLLAGDTRGVTVARVVRTNNTLQQVDEFPASAPVIALSASQCKWSRRSEHQPARLLLSTLNGSIDIRNLRSGEELHNSKIRTSAVFDNLGVVRALPQDQPLSPAVKWRLEKLQATNRSNTIEPLYSVNVVGLVVESNLLANPADGQIVTQCTDIRFTCDSLKVSATDGSLTENLFSEEDYHPGCYGFYSTISAATGSGLEPVKNWPRLHGVPFYVTALRKLKMSDREPHAPQQMVFDAVLLNPDEPASGMETPGKGQRIPGVVHRALSRGSTFRVEVVFGNSNKITISAAASQIDWVFGLNRQQQLPDPQRGFDGRLARLQGGVRLQGNAVQIAFKPSDISNSSAAIFGRLWPLGSLPDALQGYGEFIARKRNGKVDWQQAEFGYREITSPTPAQELPLLIATKEDLSAGCTIGWDKGLAFNRTVADPAWLGLAGEYLITVDGSGEPVLVHRRTGKTTPFPRPGSHLTRAKNAALGTSRRSPENDASNQNSYYTRHTLIGQEYPTYYSAGTVSIAVGGIVTGVGTDFPKEIAGAYLITNGRTFIIDTRESGQRLQLKEILIAPVPSGKYRIVLPTSGNLLRSFSSGRISVVAGKVRWKDAFLPTFASPAKLLLDGRTYEIEWPPIGNIIDLGDTLLHLPAGTPYEVVFPANIPGDSGSAPLVALAMRAERDGDIAAVETSTVTRVTAPNHGLRAGDAISLRQLEMPAGNQGQLDKQFTVLKIDDETLYPGVPLGDELSSTAAVWEPVIEIEAIETPAGQLIVNSPAHGLENGQHLELVRFPSGTREQSTEYRAVGTTGDPDHFHLVENSISAGNRSGEGTWRLLEDSDTSGDIQEVLATTPITVRASATPPAWSRIEISGVTTITVDGIYYVLPVAAGEFKLLKAPTGITTNDVLIAQHKIHAIRPADGWIRSPDHNLLTGDYVSISHTGALDGFGRRVKKSGTHAFQVLQPATVAAVPATDVYWRSVTPDNVQSVQTGPAAIVIEGSPDSTDGLSPGDTVFVQGVREASAANGVSWAFDIDHNANTLSLWRPRGGRGLSTGEGTWTDPNNPTNTGDIASVTADDPLTIITVEDHELNTGDSVEISGVTGIAEANSPSGSAWRIVRLNNRKFQIYEPVVSSTGSATGGAWCQLNATPRKADSVVTGAPAALQSAGHGLKPGEWIFTTGGETLFHNRLWIVFEGATPTHIELWAIASSSSAASTGGAWKRLIAIPHSIPDTQRLPYSRIEVKNSRRVVAADLSGAVTNANQLIRLIRFGPSELKLFYHANLAGIALPPGGGARWIAPADELFAAATDGAKRLYSGSAIGGAEIYSTQPQKREIDVLLTSRVGDLRVALTVDEDIADSRNRINIWNIEPVAGKRFMRRLKLDNGHAIDSVSALALSDGGLMVAVRDSNKQAHIWRLALAGDTLRENVSFSLNGVVCDYEPVSLVSDGGQQMIAVAKLIDKKPFLQLWAFTDGSSPIEVRRFALPAAPSAIEAQESALGVRIAVTTGNATRPLDIWVLNNVLRISSRRETPPTYRLEVAIPPEIGNSLALEASITQARQLELRVRPAHSDKGQNTRVLIPQLQQGEYHTFIASPADTAGIRGAEVLALWPEGDLLENLVLGVLYLAHSKPVDATIDFKTPSSVTLPLTGSLVHVDMIASQLVNPGAPAPGVLAPVSSRKWLHSRSESRVVRSKGGRRTPELKLILEGHFSKSETTSTMAGTLIWTEPDGSAKPHLQAPIRMACKAPFTSKPVWELIAETHYLSPRVVLNNLVSDAAISVPGRLKPSQFNVQDTVPAAAYRSSEQYARLEFSQSGGIAWTLVAINNDEVPLDLNLDPAAFRKVPQQPGEALQVAHYRVAGVRQRYAIPTTQLTELPSTGSDEIKLPAHKDWSLAPVVNDGLRIVILSEPSWLVESDSPVAKLFTQSLMVLFRPRSFSSSAPAPKFARTVENRTVEEPTVNVEYYRNLLKSTGVAGVSLVRRIDSAGNGDFQIIRSPFYDHGAELTELDHFHAVLQNPSSRVVYTAHTANGTAERLDFRLLTPAEILQIGGLELRFRYRPDELPRDHFRENGCTPMRTTRFRREGPRDKSGRPRKQVLLSAALRVENGAAAGTFRLAFGAVRTAPIPYNAKAEDVFNALKSLAGVWEDDLKVTGGDLPDNQLRVELSAALSANNARLSVVDNKVLEAGGETPVDVVLESLPAATAPAMRILEATAFQQMSSTTYLPESARIPGARDQLFLPRTMDVRQAVDKPGATFHQSLQQYTGRAISSQPSWKIEPVTDYALREPQHIRVHGCVSARMELTAAQLQSTSTGSIAQLNFEWDEILGAVDMATGLMPAIAFNLSGGELLFQSPRPADGNLPLQLMIQFNQDFLDILPGDQATPAYRVEKNTGSQNPKAANVLPPTFLVSKDATLAQHKHIAGAEVMVEAIAGNTPPILTLPAPHDLQDGDVVSIRGAENNTGVNIANANYARWRVLVSPHDPTAECALYRDTVSTRIHPDDTGTWAVGGVVKPVKTSSNTSPVVVALDDAHGLATGAAVTVAGLNVADGVYHVLVLDDTSFALLKPGNITFSGSYASNSGRLRKVTTSLKPWFRGSPTRTGNILVEGTGLVAELSGSEEEDGRYFIHVDEVEGLPAAEGDWCVFPHDDADGDPADNGDKKWHLHTISYGNGAPIANTGRAGGKTVESASNTAPIVVTVTGHGLTSGTLVDITGVEGNTAANGTDWRIRTVDKNSFELHRDSLAGAPDATSFNGITYHRLCPLIEVLKPAVPHRASGANLFELSATSTQLDWGDDVNVRPLLQFSWSGRVFQITKKAVSLTPIAANVYEESKQIKFLNPCMLSPKLAAVIVLPDKAASGYALQRTVLFGDSAPATQGQPRIVAGTGAAFHVEYVIEGNRELLNCALPDADILTSPVVGNLYLLKYLITGVTIYDQRPVRMP